MLGTFVYTLGNTAGRTGGKRLGPGDRFLKTRKEWAEPQILPPLVP